MDGREISEKRFRVLFTLLRRALPVYVEEVSIPYKLYFWFVMLTVYSLAAALIMDAINNTDDLKRLMAIIRILIGISVHVWFTSYVSMFPESFDRLFRFSEQFTWEDLPTIDHETGETTMAGWIPKILVISNYTSMGVFIFHVINSSYRIFIEHDLVLNTWYPFDTTISPNYELVVLSQIFASYVCISVIMGHIGLYGVIVAVGGSQLEKVKISLLNLTQSEDLQEQLNQCIRHHQQTLEYIDEIENSLNGYHCGQMLIFFAGICIDAFSAVTSWGDITDVFQAFTGYVVLAAEVFVICWFGTKLTDKAESIRNAAWEIDWTGTPISFQKSVMFIMARGNKEFALTAGKFVSLSNETLLNIMQESFSFFMFLLHVKDRNENIHVETH